MVIQQLHRKGNKIMSKKAIAAAVAVISMNASLSHADDLEKSMFSIKGFGTLGVVHSSEDGADFRGSVVQPNGAGRTHDWDMGVDSKIGGQISAQFTDKLSGVVQAVVQHQYDNSYRPQLEWANLKYQITDDLSVRAGRIVLPAFMVSESRYVGYAQPWLRPPQEIYTLSSITNSDGADITYRTQIGKATNTAQAFYGKSTLKLESGEIKGNPIWGFNDTVEIDALTLRAAYVYQSYDFDFSSLEPLITSLDQYGDYVTSLGYTQAGSQAHHLADKYSLKDIAIHIYTLGANYDPGNWFVMGEIAKYQGEGFTHHQTAGYVTGGYRIAEFTPYVTFAKIKSNEVTESISTAGMPTALATGTNGLVGGVNTVLDTFACSQNSASIGVRWDFSRHADLKIQYDRLSLEDGTIGRLANPEAGFDGDKVNIVSAAIDFVF